MNGEPPLATASAQPFDGLDIGALAERSWESRSLWSRGQTGVGGLEALACPHAMVYSPSFVGQTSFTVLCLRDGEGTGSSRPFSRWRDHRRSPEGSGTKFHKAAGLSAVFSTANVGFGSMAIDTITCKSCGAPMALDEALYAQLEQEYRHQNEQRYAAREAQAIELDRKKYAIEFDLLKRRLAAVEAERDIAQGNELGWLERAEEIERREKNIPLEVARLANAEVAVRVAEQQKESELKLAAKELQIAALHRKAEDLQRGTLQGLPAFQGNALEHDIGARMQAAFEVLGDKVTVVGKGGLRGADRLLTVCDKAGRALGRILVEGKNTRHWGADWLNKAKTDQQGECADLVVIASAVVPSEIRENGGFGEIDSVFVADLRCWLGLVFVLRRRLIDVKAAYAAAEGKAGAAGQVYDLVISGQFWDWLRAIIDVLGAEDRQDGRLRAAVLAHFDKQRRNRERFLSHLVTIVGSLQAAIGSGAPTLPKLEFDPGDGLDDEPDRADGPAAG